MTSYKEFIFFVVSLLCHSATLIKADPPDFVYRADFREPSNLFRNGMRHLGDNFDLMDHVRGASSNAGDLKNTAFVATTSEEAVARRFGIGLLWSTPDAGPFIYVYTIRATEFFYEVDASLRKAYKETGSRGYLSLADMFKAEKEWVAYQGIRRSLIKSVKVYKQGSSKGTGEFVRAEDNPIYLPGKTRGNADVFPVEGLSQEATLVASSSPDPVSACFASCLASPSPRSSSGGECKMKKIVYETNLLKGRGTFYDPVKKTLVEGILPWQEETTTEGGHTIEKPKHCTINTGHPNETSPLLKIRCLKNRFWDNFRVVLKGGTGQTTLFHYKNKGGVTGRTWKKSARQIPLTGGLENLFDMGYTVNEVFADTFGRWWTEIHIYPVYPRLHE